MSADNWAACPRCMDAAMEAVVAERDRVNALYGQVPAAEYLQALEALPSPPDFDREENLTFREDYEIGTYGGSGVLYIRYKGACTKCGLRTEFEHEQTFYTRETSDDAAA